MRAEDRTALIRAVPGRVRGLLESLLAERDRLHDVVHDADVLLGLAAVELECVESEREQWTRAVETWRERAGRWL